MGLLGFPFVGLKASLKDYLTGVSGCKRILCPSYESRRRSVTINAPGFTFCEVIQLFVCYDTWIFYSKSIPMET